MKNLIATFCALLLTSLAAFAGDKFPDITHDQLKQAIAEKKVVLIDVNGTDSYKAGHIPGALDFEKVEATLAKSLPADKGALIVAYCGNEQCTAFAFAAEKAKELGYTNVKHYAPGIAGWKKVEKTEPGA
jgi:rhodanese-related sulfurtransferase